MVSPPEATRPDRWWVGVKLDVCFSDLGFLSLDFERDRDLELDADRDTFFSFLVLLLLLLESFPGDDLRELLKSFLPLLVLVGVTGACPLRVGVLEVRGVSGLCSGAEDALRHDIRELFGVLAGEDHAPFFVFARSSSTS
mmetsp:Transcript_39787/g.77733  ORF Transcript_39787/g.77733 Transcript_39787/m.77733 type:complete len:140 (-) Transcript_39787:926-1345(-)